MTQRLETIYVDEDIAQRVKQLAFSRGCQKSEMYLSLMRSGLLALDASGERSTADEIDDRHRLMIEFREARIAELVADIDDQFTARWEEVRRAVRSVYDDGGNVLTPKD
jgi:hypothetical protein